VNDLFFSFVKAFLGIRAGFKTQKSGKKEEKHRKITDYF
jgi:hypothetical protein